MDIQRDLGRLLHHGCPNGRTWEEGAFTTDHPFGLEGRDKAETGELRGPI